MAGGRAALPLQDTHTATELAKLVGQAFPVGWARAHLHPDLPPAILELLAPTLYGMGANSTHISFEKGFAASVR
eukprot:315423-Lingulodinium_polyedra.AAC.1